MFSVLSLHDYCHLVSHWCWGWYGFCGVKMMGREREREETRKCRWWCRTHTKKAKKIQDKMCSIIPQVASKVRIVIGAGIGSDWSCGSEESALPSPRLEDKTRGRTDTHSSIRTENNPHIKNRTSSFVWQNRTEFSLPFMSCMQILHSAVEQQGTTLKGETFRHRQYGRVCYNANLIFHFFLCFILFQFNISIYFSIYMVLSEDR